MMTMSHSHVRASLALILSLSLVLSSVKAQISTPCSMSMISSFTPCLNYVTGSSGTGSSPTKDCCNSLISLMTDNMECACLIITGNVPVSIPFVNNLAISLPRVCKSSVPLQCKASGVPLPAPGPVLFRPPPPPAPVPVFTQAPAPAPHSHTPKAANPAPHSHSPKASKTTAAEVAAPPPAGGSDIAPAIPPKFALGPSANPGIRPVVNHKSASSPSPTVSFSSLVVIFVAFKLLW